MDIESLTAALRDAFAPLIEADEVDIEVGQELGEVEVVAETWTLHLEGLPEAPRGWIAIDDEPENAADIRVAREEAMGTEAMAALVQADSLLGGALRGALTASDDPISVDLAAALRADASQAPQG